MEAAAAKYKVAYFPAAARAEAIRMLLEEAGLPWENQFVDQIWPEYKAKETFFGQVPILTAPDGFKLAQSLAILSYIAEISGLHGKDAKERALCEMIVAGTADLRELSYKALYAPADTKEKYMKEFKEDKLPVWLGYMNKLVKKNGDSHFVGHRFLYPDLVVFDLLEQLQRAFPGCTDAFPELKEVYASVAARPRIAAYLASDRHLKD